MEGDNFFSQFSFDLNSFDDNIENMNSPIIDSSENQENLSQDCSIDQKNEELMEKSRRKLTKQEKSQQRYLSLKLKNELKRKKSKQKRMEKFHSLSVEEQNQLKFQSQQEKERKEQNLLRSYTSNYHICIDCDHSRSTSNSNSLHSTHELRSLATQIRLSYMELKAHEGEESLSLHLSSFHSQFNPTIYQILTSQGIQNWKIHLHENQISDQFPSPLVTYLSPDAEEPLEMLSPHRIYVIGGIIDKNIKRYVSYDKAMEMSCEIKRLPIQEYYPHSKGSNTVLNVDQVVRSLLIFHSTKSWERALLAAIPPRRRGGRGGGGCGGVGVREGDGEGGEGEGDEENHEEEESEGEGGEEEI